MITRLARINKQSAILTIPLVALMVSHQLIPKPLTSVLVIGLAILLISGFMPTSNQNLRITLAFAFLAIGFFTYLIIRGLFVFAPINSADLALTVAASISLAILIRHVNRDRNDSLYQPLGLNAVGGSAALLAVVSFSLHLKQKGEEYFLAWTGSGDSRNHVQAIYAMADKGSIDFSSILFPQISTSISVFISSGNTTDLLNDSSARLRIDLLSYTFTWLLLIAVLGYSYAAVWESLISKSKISSVNKAWVHVPVSLVAVSSFALGTYLRDGFVSALAGSVAISMAVAFVLNNSELMAREQFLTILLVMVFALLSWTLLVVPVGLLLLPSYFIWIGSTSRKSCSFYSCIWFFLLLLVGLNVFNLLFSDTFVTTLNFPGSISAISQNILFAFVAVFVIYFLLVIRFDTGIAFRYLLVAIAAIFSFVGFKSAIGLDYLTQNYYASKFTTILIIGLFAAAVLFIPAGIALLTDRTQIGRVELPIGMLLIAILVNQGLDFVSPVPKLWRSIESGWVQPNADTISLVLSLPNDPKNPTVLFKFRPDDPGATRLGDFWLGTYATPREPYQSWSYVGNQEGDLRGFCGLNEGYPTMTVITRDPNLSTRMFGYCPEQEIDIEWVP